LIMTVFLCGSTVWIETSQEDFRDGIYESNLYASMKDGGTIEFTFRWDLNGDGFLDIVVSNERDSISYVYWGSASGYSSSNRTEYAVMCGGDVETVDVDFDGCPELIFSSCTGNYIRVFRGTQSGPNPTDYFDLPVHVWNESCCIADCDKDGYLDIIVARYISGYGAIYWGGGMGYSPVDLTLLSAMGAHNFETGDFNKDGWLDILFEQQTGGSSIVYWGSMSGYNENNTSQLANPGSNTHGSSVADLNSDGYLDIVLTCFLGSPLYIYAGGDNGFTLWQILSPGSCYGGNSIADFNGDGYLDIICTPGYGVQQKPIIYWGTSNGYSQNNKTDIGVESDASGLLVADFDFDGDLDVLIHNYAYPPQSSYILKGPDFTPIYDLPTGRDHHGRFREIGNVYNREYYEDYISSVHDAGSIVAWDIITWYAQVPDGTDILFWLRSGNSPTPDGSWSAWEPVDNGGLIPAFLSARYLQYKARFIYADPVAYPALEEVCVYHTPAAINVIPRTSHSVKLHCEPNPFTDCVSIILSMSVQNDISIKILDARGGSVRDLGQVKCSSGVAEIVWDRCDNKGYFAPAGVYFIRVQGDKTSSFAKVIILD